MKKIIDIFKEKEQLTFFCVKCKIYFVSDEYTEEQRAYYTYEDSCPKCKKKSIKLLIDGCCC